MVYNLLMKSFYTRTGDDGFTGVLGEGRLPKEHPIIEAIGTLDEATAALGVARAACRAQHTGGVLLEIQRDLYHLMAEVAATPENAARFRKIDASRVDWLEHEVDLLSDQVAIPKQFIVPGDSPAGAALALSRAIVRRAERRIAELMHSEYLTNLELLHYLNRLSSLCFLLELFENQTWGQAQPTLAREG
jgi:cob(I)alamin adenosyltransferase